VLSPSRHEHTVWLQLEQIRTESVGTLATLISQLNVTGESAIVIGYLMSTALSRLVEGDARRGITPTSAKGFASSLIS